MTSLIFGSIYLGHKGFVEHRREKQRQKNYQRWEGLRDEYDEQRRISRESRSLDIQRTGTDYSQFSNSENDRPILTLRDQQEANDARTGWRPQESWDGPPVDNRRASVEVTAGSGLRPLMKNKTGATWDEGLPDPLPVTRRDWSDYQPSNLSQNVSRSASVRNNSTSNTPVRERSSSRTPSSTITKEPSPLRESTVPASRPPLTHQNSVVVVEHENPGGRMAELIEFGNTPEQPSYTPLPQTPFSPMSGTSYSQPLQSPFSPTSPIQQPPFPQTQTQTMPFGGYQQPVYAGTTAPTAPQGPDGSMQEWWNRPL